MGYSLEQIELVCKDKDAWGPLFNKTSRPRDDDETVESLWSDWDIPRRMMQVALWIKEKNEETGEWESTFWKCLKSPNAMIGASRAIPSDGVFAIAPNHAIIIAFFLPWPPSFLFSCTSFHLQSKPPLGHHLTMHMQPPMEN